MTKAIIAVDPGAASGWAIYPAGSMKPSEWGQLRLTSSGKYTEKSAKKILKIAELAKEHGVETLVIEGPYKIHLPKKKKPGWQQAGPKKKGEEPDEVGWKTYWGMGVSFGRWVQGMLNIGCSIEEINPRTWQGPTVGTGRRTQQIPKYQALATKLTGQQLPPDAAAAVVIGYYWQVKGNWKSITEQQGEKKV